MCNDCKETPCKDLSKDDCFKVNETKCDVGCEDIISTGCVFHNINANEASSRLPHIGANKGASLNYILKLIDKKFGETLNTNFESFNLNDLTTEKVSGLKSFVDVITKKIKSFTQKFDAVDKDVEELDTKLSTLSTTVTTNNKPAISSSKLDINSTDTTKQVLQALVTYLQNNSEGSVEKSHESSFTVSFSESDSDVSADVIVSPDPRNTLKSTEDGLYVGPVGTSEILDTIPLNAELTTQFTALIKSSFPSLLFDIMSKDVNTPITYINNIGTTVSVTAKSNVLLRLNDVREIKTVPTTSLTITFKGIK